MKLTLVILLLLLIIFSCNTKEKTPDPKQETRVRYVALALFPDSSRNVEYVARTIKALPKFDSSTKKYSVVIDTIGELIREGQIDDGHGKPVLDSATKKPITRIYYVERPKDSIIWLCPIPADSLLSKHFKIR